MANDAQPWKIGITPRERLELARLFLHRGLKLKGTADQRTFNRARRALGLVGPSLVLVDNKPIGRIAEDRATVHQVTMTGEVADFLRKRIFELERLGYQDVVLELVFDELEQAKDTDRAAAAAGPVPEDEVWEASEQEIEEAAKRDGKAYPCPACGQVHTLAEIVAHRAELEEGATG